ncbi:MAG: reverse transcriptase/maturase family protein [Thiopseudomonas sp.]|nr:reverse transcriptase/maturase family protein [Thiopseudomonas sp.]
MSEPKERIIYAPAFRDCVVQHAVYTVIQPIFERTFIDASFACRIGKGTHKAADYAQQALIRSPDDSYILQLDIQKFFYSIHRDILCELFKLKIKDPQMIELMMLFTVYENPLGIPIGNLLSQIYALIYMNQVDHFVVRQLKPRSGYVRYVDDFILFGLTRDEALEYRSIIEMYLHEKLRLRLSRSTIAHTRRGTNFVGYRTWRSKRFIRKHSMYKAKKSVRENRLDSFISHLAHASKTHSMQHLLNYAQEHNHDLYSQLPEKYHAGHYKNAQCA